MNFVKWFITKALQTLRKKVAYVNLHCICTQHQRQMTLCNLEVWGSCFLLWDALWGHLLLIKISFIKVKNLIQGIEFSKKKKKNYTPQMFLHPLSILSFPACLNIVEYIKPTTLRSSYIAKLTLYLCATLLLITSKH